MNRSHIILVVLIAAAALLAACAGLGGGLQLPASHPTAADLGEKPTTCTKCHDSADGPLHFERFVHGPYWGESHRQAAYQRDRVCAMCHQASFCNDCHATRVELKPSLKNQTDTYRRMPHRGDYLARHRIDGRVDPSSCFRCHGNPKSAATCARCHG